MALFKLCGDQTLLGHPLLERFVLSIVTGVCFLISLSVDEGILQKIITSKFKKDYFLKQ